MKQLLLALIVAIPLTFHPQVVDVSPNYIVQIVSTNFSAVATGSTTIPGDDTIPQNTEGDEYMTLAITPKSAANRLIIDVICLVSPNTNRQIGIALFQDSTASALAAAVASVNAAAVMQTGRLTHIMTAGTTSSTTFKIRAGWMFSTSVTITFNGFTSGRIFGAIPKSMMMITEVRP